MDVNKSDTSEKADLSELITQAKPSGKKRRIGAVAAAATLGSFLFGYDTGVISGAFPYMDMPEVAKGMMLNANQTGMVGGFLAVGAAFGALFGGRLSDRFGRKHNLLLLAGIFIFGSLFCTFAPSLWLLCLARFILGLAVGGASATVPVYLAETAPTRIRGTIVALDHMMIVIGQLAAFTFNALINHIAGGPKVSVSADPTNTLQAGEYSWSQITSFADTMSANDYHHFIDQLVISTGNGDTWRYMLVLCTLPAVALWLAMRLMPESPRWFVAKQRYYEAVASLKRLRGPKDQPIEEELGEMVTQQTQAERIEKGGFKDIFAKPWLRKLFLVGLLMAASNQLTGVNTVMYYAPRVLEFAGMSASASITSQVANGVMSVIGALLGLFLVFRFKRRSVLLFCISAVAVCMFAISALFGIFIQPHVGETGQAAPWAATAILIIMGVFLLIVQSSNGPVVWTILGEVFPANVRGVANGTAVFFLWIMNALVAWSFPIMIDYLQGGWTYAIYGIVNVAVFIGLWKWMPETHGLSMEEIETAMEERYS